MAVTLGERRAEAVCLNKTLLLAQHMTLLEISLVLLFR